MVTKKEIQKWFPETFQRFLDVFPFAVNATFELIICDKKTCTDVHEEVVAKAKANLRST